MFRYALNLNLNLNGVIIIIIIIIIIISLKVYFESISLFTLQQLYNII